MTIPKQLLAMTVQLARDHIRGPRNAPVTLVEYGDFECPHCRAASLAVEKVQRLVGNQLRYVFRHFPLVAIHPHAERAAQAAEAAGAQGEFWTMHDLMFERQDALDDDDLLLYAADIGIELGRFARELADGVHAPRVREDFLSGVQSGVSGTPTFFVNGVRHAGGYGVASLLQAVEREAPLHPAAG